MEVLDLEPRSWILLASDGRLLLDVDVHHGPVAATLLLVLDDAECAAYAREGRTYLSRLTQEVQDSAPIAAGTTSPYRARDVTAALGAQVTRAVVTWRAQQTAEHT